MIFCFIAQFNHKISTPSKLNAGFLSVLNSVSLTNFQCQYSPHQRLNHQSVLPHWTPLRKGAKERVGRAGCLFKGGEGERGGGQIFEGGDYFKYSTKEGRLFQGGPVGRLLFQEIRYP